MEIITSRKNAVSVHLKKLGSDSAYRRECGEIFCDGVKLLREAVKSGAEVTCVLTELELPFRLPDTARVHKAPRDLITSLSPLKNPQGLIFACKTPAPNVMRDAGTQILLDGIQDPGNLGAILRSADAFGIGTVMLFGNCADVFNPKTIRASMGAVFRVAVTETSMDKLRVLPESGRRIIGAALSDTSRDISRLSLKNAIIAIGSEGGGLSEEVLSVCSELIEIPISDNCESLNAAVAASIIMWEATKK